jgi:septal ring factor EnvC (AmiA/AmiB activator)
MSQLMGLVESTKITLDNREDLVVDMSTELVEKGLQVEQMATQIQELEEQVGARENTIKVLEDQLLTTQQQLEEANQHLDMHHQEIQDMEAEGANEDVDIEGERSRGLHPAWTLLAQEDHLPPSLVVPRLPISFQRVG